MSGLVLPAGAPHRTRNCVMRSLIAAPQLTRLLDTPGLLVAVCFDAAAAGKEIDFEKLAAAARTPHRDLAARFGMPSLGVLRRLTGGVLTELRMQRLRTLFTDRVTLRLLRHAKRISASIVDSLWHNDVRPHVANRFISELGNMPLRNGPRARDIITLGTFLHEYLPNTSIHSLRHFDRLWEEHGEQVNGHANACRLPTAFPPPPWSDEPGYAFAIRTPRELVAESVRMRNCAGILPAFSRDIRRGRSYFFHVEGRWGLPEATMSCVMDGGNWRIDDVRAFGNGMLDQRYVRCLATWIADRQGLSDAELCMPREKSNCHPFGIRRGRRVQ